MLGRLKALPTALWRRPRCCTCTRQRLAPYLERVARDVIGRVAICLPWVGSASTI
jgi:hypothetical protein